MSNLKAVLVQLKQERSRLNQAIAALESIGNYSGRSRPASQRVLSASARARIAAAQRARWAKARRSKVVPITKGRRTISPAGRARIVAAQRARWAAVRAKRMKR